MVLRKLSQSLKITMAMMLSVLSSGILQAVPASAYSLTNPDDEYKKVYVCKYVGTPGVDETLQASEQNPISVSTSALKDFNGLGTYFNDKHEKSVAIAWDNGDKIEPSISMCPAPATADGNLDIETDCEEITLSSSAIVPAGGTVTYKIDGTLAAVGVNEVSEGSHTVQLLVNGGVVDSTTVNVEKCEERVVPVNCVNPTNGGAITDKTQGWSLVGDAEFVNGAVSISSDNWVDGGISFTNTYPVAEVQNLDWDLDTTGVTGAYGVGILLKTENGDVIHYEPTYADDFWSDSAVLPMNGGGQGGKYSGSLQDLLDTIGNVNIIKTTFVFTSAEANEGVLLTSLSFNCATYTFNKSPRVPTECTVSNNPFTKEWAYDNATYPDAADYYGITNNATYVFKADGMHISTPDDDSSVYGLIDAGSTPIQDVDKMSYDTYRKTMSAGYASTQPAYILVVDTNGEEADGEAYFFYEPYNNSSSASTEDAWMHWDAIDGGSAKWWMSGTGQALHTWDYFVEKYPAAIVLAYGFNLGTSNAETYATVQSLEFDCATTTFSNGSVLGDDDDTDGDQGGGMGGGQVQGDATQTTKTVGTSTALLPATIPATGGANSPLAIILASILAYGAAFFLQGKRNFLKAE